MSSEDHQNREILKQDYAAEEYTFDELAKEMAGGTISRGRALKLFGAAILGTFGLASLSSVAEAKKKKKKKKHRHRGGTSVGTGPVGQTCTSTSQCTSGLQCSTIPDPGTCGSGTRCCIPEGGSCQTGTNSSCQCCVPPGFTSAICNGDTCQGA